MSRLHKKCLVASTGTHLLLLSLLLISPAFVTPKREPELPVLTLIPTTLTDEPFFGGGSPKAATPPAPAASPEMQPVASPPPQPEPPKAEVIPAREPDPTPPEAKPPKPTPRAKPPKVSTPKPDATVKPEPETASTEKPAKPKHEIKPTFSKSADTSKALAEAKARAKAEADARAAQAQFQEKLSRVGERLAKNLSPGTSIDIPGPGGEAYANYGQVVKSKYQNAWLPPEDVADDSAIVKTKVVILRDGKVKSAVIIKRSGIPSLDRSVERALELDFIAAFPAGAKDAERTFHIDFNLKTKRSTG